MSVILRRSVHGTSAIVGLLLLCASFVGACSDGASTDDAATTTTDSGADLADAAVDVPAADQTTPQDGPGDAGPEEGSTADAVQAADTTSSEGVPPPPAPSGGGACTAGGWCWENPKPFGVNIHGIWGTDPANIFVAGNDEGTGYDCAVYHYDGAAWSRANVHELGRLHAISGSASTVYAVGTAGTMLSFDGQSWQSYPKSPSNDLYGVWVHSPSAVFSVGENGIMKYKHGSGAGVASTFGNSNHLRAVWAHDDATVFAVGDSGKITTFDGQQLSLMTSGVDAHLRGVWGASGNDVFAVGDAGTIVHYDGSQWAPMTTPVSENLHAVWGNGKADIFAVGESGTVLHYDGTTWTAMSSLTDKTLRAVWGSGASFVLAGGDHGTLLHYDGAAWTMISSSVTDKNLASVWGESTSSLIAVGQGGTIVEYDGTAWKPMTSSSSQDLNAVWGSDSQNVFAVGEAGTVLRFDGSSWGAMVSNTTFRLTDVWGSGSSNVYAAGNSGTVLKYNETAWVVEDPGTTSNIDGIWVGGPNDVYIASYPTLRRFDGTEWKMILSSNVHYSAVRGSSPTEVVFLGKNELRHYDGQAWGSSDYIPQELYFKPDYSHLWVHSLTSIVAVGTDGAVIRSDGVDLTPEQLGIAYDLNGVWGDSSGIVVVGEKGTILRHHP